MVHGRYSKFPLLCILFALSFLSSCERFCSVLGSESGGFGDEEVGGGEAGYDNEEAIRKEMIKVQILQRLGLSEKPHVDQTHKLSKDLALQILKRTDNLHQSPPTTNTTTPEDDNNFAKTSEIISFSERGPLFNGHTLLSFSYAGNNAYGVGVRVKKAHIWIKVEYISSMGRHFGHILHPKGVNLYVFTVNGNFSHKKNANNLTSVHLTSQDVQMDLVVSRTIKTGAESLGWQKLDVTSVVQKWYNKHNRHRIRHGNHGKNKDKLTILVDCAGCGNSIQPITFSQSDAVISNKDESQNRESIQHQGERDEEDEEGEKEQSSNLPFIVIETDTAPNAKRSRRRALECGPRVKHCCKQRFYVSFHELGWDDWIIQPKGYYANYCRGHCGGPFRTPDTFLNYHTHVMEQYKRTPDGQATNLEALSPGCCSPTKFAPMSLIYFGPDYNIIKRDLPNLIVSECGCP